jgi:mannitol-1-/sugar-/sorbitol-6-phosphatase
MAHPLRLYWEGYATLLASEVMAGTLGSDRHHLAPACFQGPGLKDVSYWFTIARELTSNLSDDMTQVHCSALLFDMDGVLINSTPAVARVWRQWAIEHGFNPEEVVARAHGRPSLTTVREYLPSADHEAENREVERREIEDLEGVVPLPGALELLASLPSDRWTIVTSCTRPLAEVRIKAAGLPLPRKLITSNDITHGKPNPEPFLKGASLLGFPPAECIVFEDVPAGVRAGKAAGAKVIAFTTTVRESALREAGADWVLNGCADVRLIDRVMNLTLELNLA